MMSLREFMRERRRAGILIGLIYDLPREMRGKGWEIYVEWLEYRISFEEALNRLRRLASNVAGDSD